MIVINQQNEAREMRERTVAFSSFVPSICDDDVNEALTLLMLTSMRFARGTRLAS